MAIRGLPQAMLVLLAGVLATIDIRRGGWLDRVVQYQREKFINDIQKIAPVKINATIIPVPPGYQDSKNWDFASVTHLLILIRESDIAAPVHRVLRRVMQPTRRLMMSMADSFKHFPSLSKQSLNEFYYDVGSAEDYPETIPDTEQGVIVVSNPVEARLPSAQISIQLLKDILIQRALAARQMPSTTASTIPWTPMNKTNAPPGGDGGDAGDGTTAAGDAGGAGGDAGGDAGGNAGGGEPGAEGEPGDPEAEGEGGETEPEGEEEAEPEDSARKRL